MKTLVIYTSQTGFTKKYAELISVRMNADILTIDEAKKKAKDFFLEYDAIVYGGWAMAGNIVGVKWFLNKALEWKTKKVAVFCVGASPRENPDVDVFLNNMINDEQKTYIMSFYCQGGIDYSRMKFPYKFMMKSMVSVLKKKKDATEKEKEMAKYLSGSYDISDEKYIEPIIEYLEGV